MRKVLDEKKVRAMRRLYWVKHLHSICIARLYGVHPQTVFDAVTYRTWLHVDDNFGPEEITRKDTEK